MGSTRIGTNIQSRVDGYRNTTTENLIASRTCSCCEEVRTWTGTAVIGVKRN